MSDFVLAIDQGTTSSRAIVFGSNGAVLGMGAERVPSAFSRNRVG